MDTWHDYPMNDSVNWPRDEKIIGVLGLAPLATVDFYQKLCSIKVNKDWQYPRVIIDSNPKIPSRGRYLELGEADPVPFIKKGIRALFMQGAEIIAIPCNTAHILYSKYAKGSPVLLPNIIHITAQTCINVKANKILILASKLTIQHRLYQNIFQINGVDFIVPNKEEQGLVSNAIEEVKKNQVQQATREKLYELINFLGADTVILACTELPVIFNRSLEGVTMIDSSYELAKYCLEYAMSSYISETR